MARRAERNPLLRHPGVGVLRVIRRDQLGHIDQVSLGGRLAGPLVYRQRQLLSPEQCHAGALSMKVLVLLPAFPESSLPVFGPARHGSFSRDARRAAMMGR